MSRKIVTRVARWVVSIGIIALLIVFARGVNWGEAWLAMRTASPTLLAAAVVVNIFSLLIRGVRWWILLSAAGAPSLGLATRATIAGAGLNNVLVANGGEAARVVFITRATGLPSSKVLATVALDRLFDPIGFLLLLAIGVFAFEFPPQMERFRWAAVAALVIITALLVWLGITARSAKTEVVPERRVEQRNWRSKLRVWLVDFVGSMRELATGPRVVWIVILTILAWVAQLATFVFAAAAAHVSLPFGGSLAALLATNVSLIVRATPGNVGFFQFAYALATEPFGVDRDRAIAVSLLIQTLQIIPVTLLGIVLAPEFIFRRKPKVVIPVP